nr:M23 family metallopeptidase [Micromonospora sp. DSM 115978]
MQNESIENASGPPGQPAQHRQHPPSNDTATVVRHRLRRRVLRGRLPVVAAALVAAAGITVVGVATATTRDGDRSDQLTVAEAQERARAEAAERADRADRPDQSNWGGRAGWDGPDGDPTPGSPTGDPSTAAPETPDATPEESPEPEPSEQPSSAAPEARKATADWVHPMPGAATTSCYGMRWGVLHAGIDLAMPADTPIRAAGAGTVVEAGWVYAGYGISVVIDHGDGVLTHYAHQNSTAVSVGQQVAAGEVIGYEGSTGDSTGPHLHFEVHNGLWNQLDPAPWMRERGVDLGC